MRDQILLPVNKEMKSLISAIEHADCSVNLSISASTLDSSKLSEIRESLKDLSSSFALSSECVKLSTAQPKVSSSQTALQTPRTHYNVPVIAKGSFAPESLVMARSSSHDRLSTRSRPGLSIAPSSTREVPDLKSKEVLPIVEVSLDPEVLMPSVNDTKFNDFLESELERIKRMFLEDGPIPKSLGKEKSTIKKSVIDNGTISNDLFSLATQTARKNTSGIGSSRGLARPK